MAALPYEAIPTAVLGGCLLLVGASCVSATMAKP
jgi:hypothetical protein